MITNNTKKLIVLFLIILSFAFWYLIWRWNYNKNIVFTNNQKNTQQINSNILSSVIKNIIQPNINLTLFYEVYKITSENFYSFNEISKETIVYGIIKWFINSLDDKYNEFFNPDEAKKFNEILEWDFEWIWAVIKKHDFWVVIDSFIAGSPAKESWILVWDIIIKANNIELQDLSLTDSVSNIRWKSWTTVKLEIIRVWEKEIIIKNIIRKKINIPSIDSKILENNVWYIILSIFWEKSSEEFKQTLNNLLNQNIKGLILDLRDNWWGYLETANNILSNFIEKDKLLVSTKNKNPLLQRSYFSNWDKNFNLPLVIIINENSASASEIVAWAIKDYWIWIITWEKSYWKWSVQNAFRLSDGSELKITTAKWYTPNNHWIDKEWIKPDIIISFKKEDYENQYDRQLEESKNIIQKYIELNNTSKTIEFYNQQKNNIKTQKINNIINSWSTN
jgi:carboxyl-terminal processing protease